MPTDLLADIHRGRARHERLMADRATCDSAILAHRNLAALHDRAALRAAQGGRPG